MKIKVLGKSILESFHHNIYEMDLSSLTASSCELEAVEIDKDNMAKAGSAVGNTTGRWIKEDYPYAHGYYFIDKQGNNVGSCWYMDNGGDEKLYRIREHDSFIFRVQVNEAYQGKGYSKQILHLIFEILKEKGYKKTCLACAVKNSIANSLYNSIGMNKIGEISFIRLFSKNIPYRIL